MDDTNVIEVRKDTSQVVAPGLYSESTGTGSVGADFIYQQQFQGDNPLAVFGKNNQNYNFLKIEIPAIQDRYYTVSGLSGAISDYFKNERLNGDVTRQVIFESLKNALARERGFIDDLRVGDTLFFYFDKSNHWLDQDLAIISRQEKEAIIDSNSDRTDTNQTTDDILAEEAREKLEAQMDNAANGVDIQDTPIDALNIENVDEIPEEKESENEIEVDKSEQNSEDMTDSVDSPEEEEFDDGSMLDFFNPEYSPEEEN